MTDACLIPLTDGERGALLRGRAICGADFFRAHALEVTGSGNVQRLSLDKTPYLAEPLDAAGSGEHEEVGFLAGTRLGKTVFARSAAAHRALTLGGVTIVGAPNDEKAEQYFGQRLRRSIVAMDVVAELLPPPGTKAHREAVTNTRITLPDAELIARGLGTALNTKSEGAMTIVLEEPDDIAHDLAGQGNPIDLLEERMGTLRDAGACMIVPGTPTTLLGHMARRWRTLWDHRRFYLPCPRCGFYAALAARPGPFHGAAPLHTLRFEPGAAPETLEAPGNEAASWLVCGRCRGRIEHHERAAMLALGRWVCLVPTPGGEEADERGETIGDDGVIEGVSADGEPVRFERGETPTPATCAVRRVRAGYWLNALYSPWRSLGQFAAQLRRAKRMGDARLISFVNNWCGEPFRLRGQDLRVEDLRRRCDGPPPGVLPAWTRLVTMGVDVQQDGVWWLRMAFGGDMRTAVVDWGFAEETDEWRPQGEWGAPAAFLEAWRRCDEDLRVHGTQRTLRAQLALVDIGEGKRQDEIVNWCWRSAWLLAPSKGFHDMPEMIRDRTIEKYAGAQDDGVPCVHINVEMVKNALHRRLTAPAGAPGSMTLPAMEGARGEGLEGEGTGASLDTLLRHMTGETRVHTLRSRRGMPLVKTAVFAWTPRTEKAANHLWDCAVYAYAAGVRQGAERMIGEERTAEARSPRSGEAEGEEGGRGSPRPATGATEGGGEKEERTARRAAAPQEGEKGEGAAPAPRAPRLRGDPPLDMRVEAFDGGGDEDEAWGFGPVR